MGSEVKNNKMTTTSLIHLKLWIQYTETLLPLFARMQAENLMIGSETEMSKIYYSK